MPSRSPVSSTRGKQVCTFHPLLLSLSRRSQCAVSSRAIDELCPCSACCLASRANALVLRDKQGEKEGKKTENEKTRESVEGWDAEVFFTLVGTASEECQKKEERLSSDGGGEAGAVVAVVGTPG